MHLVEPVLTKQDRPLWIYYLRGLTLLLIARGHTGAEWGEQLYGLLEILQGATAPL